MAEPYADDLFSSHTDIWDFIKDYYKEFGSVPDASTIEQKFRDFDLVEVEGPTAYHLTELKNEYAKVNMQSAITEAATQLRDGEAATKVLDKLQNDLGKLNKLTSKVSDTNITDYQTRLDAMKVTKSKNRDGFEGVGIFSEINGFDEAYKGMRGGELIVIMGWTGSAKTWLSTLLACRAWQQGYKPMIVSLEMSSDEMAARVDTVLGLGEFSNSDLLTGNIEFDKFEGWAKKTFTGKQDFIIVTNENMDRVTADTVQAKIDQHRPDLVICDYHQLFDDAMRGQGETERQGNISKSFKRLATRNNIPVIDITAVTLDDAKKTNQPPELFHVAWAKRIAYDAHLALAVGKQDNLLSVVARKNRRGPEFSFFLDWDIDMGIVTELYDG